MKNGRCRWWLTLLLKAVLSALLLILIFRRVDLGPGGLMTRLASARIELLAVGLLAFPCLIVLKAMRWKLLVAESGYAYPLFSCIRAYFAAFAAGVVTPGRLGEFLKAGYLHAEAGVDMASAFRTILGDRIYDLLFLCCFGTVAYLSLFQQLPAFAWLPLFLALYLCVLAGVFLFLRISRNIHINHGLLNRLKEFVEQVANDFHGWTSVINWLLTATAYALYFFICFLLLKALGIDIPFLTVSFITALMSLVLLIPISIAGFGPREITLVFLLERYGVCAEDALSFSLLQFAIFFLYGGLLGAVFLVVSPAPSLPRRAPAREE